MKSWQRFLIEVSESAVLSCLEPERIHFRREHENDVPRVRAAICRAKNGRLARFRPPMNRNGFLLACLDYTEHRENEYLVVGYGFRNGSTTKIESLHLVIGSTNSVAIPATVAHALWNHCDQHDANEVILFHNHPLNPLNLLVDNLPLASQADRLTLESRALRPIQLVRRVLGQGRVIFYLGENGFVKQFHLPSILRC